MMALASRLATLVPFHAALSKGVAVDRAGALLVADDVGNIVWRVQSAAAKQ